MAVNNDEERAILNDGIANRDSATKIQRRIDASRAGQGGQAGPQGRQGKSVTREAIMADVDSAVRPYLRDIMKLDGGVLVGYRGSLARGTKGPHKDNAPFDPKNFDVDAFIVSDKLAARFPPGREFRSGWDIPEIRPVQAGIDRALRRNSNFSGLRKGRFTFKIVTRKEYSDLWLKRDANYIIKVKDVY